MPDPIDLMDDPRALATQMVKDKLAMEIQEQIGRTVSSKPARQTDSIPSWLKLAAVLFPFVMALVGGAGSLATSMFARSSDLVETASELRQSIRELQALNKSHDAVHTQHDTMDTKDHAQLERRLGALEERRRR